MATVCAGGVAVHTALSSGTTGGEAFLQPLAVSPLDGMRPASAALRTGGVEHASAVNSESIAVGATASVIVAAAAVGGAMRRRGLVRRKNAAQFSGDPDSHVMTGTMTSPQALPPGTKVNHHTFIQHGSMPSGPVEPTMSDEEAEKYLADKVAKLKELLPDDDLFDGETFDEYMEEQRWLWARELLPFSSRGRVGKESDRQNLAAHKWRTVERQQEFFKQLMLFQPLALKYPTLLKRLIKRDIQDIECKEMRLNAHWIANEEQIAGFTYEDWTNATNGGKYEDFKQPEIGDMITGVVAAMNQEGAYIEIGTKNWAFLQLENISLSNIGTPSEVLTMGEEIQARIIDAGVGSVIYGDGEASQYVLSMTELKTEAAWDEIENIMNAVEGTSSIMEVDVITVRPGGAVVKTLTGLEGFIPNGELADKAGDTGLAGTRILVELKSAIPQSQEGAFQGSRLVFSYRNAATKELAKNVVEGDVVEGIVCGIRDSSIDVMIQGVQVQIGKVDISQNTRFDMQDVFEMDEEIKAAVFKVIEKTGEVRLSIRALEAKRGQVLTNKEKMFANAERTAKKFFAKMQEQVAKFETALDGGTVDGGDQDDDDVF